MVTVTFTTALQRHVPALPQKVEPGNLREVMARVFESLPLLRSYVMDDQGAVRKHVAIFINGATINDRRGLTDLVPDGSEVYVMQALSGG